MADSKRCRLSCKRARQLVRATIVAWSAALRPGDSRAISHVGCCHYAAQVRHGPGSPARSCNATSLRYAGQSNFIGAGKWRVMRGHRGPHLPSHQLLRGGRCVNRCDVRTGAWPRISELSLVRRKWPCPPSSGRRAARVFECDSAISSSLLVFAITGIILVAPLWSRRPAAAIPGAPGPMQPAACMPACMPPCLRRRLCSVGVPVVGRWARVCVTGGLWRSGALGAGRSESPSGPTGPMRNFGNPHLACDRPGGENQTHNSKCQVRRKSAYPDFPCKSLTLHKFSL